jgi:hypothetical protein
MTSRGVGPRERARRARHPSRRVAIAGQRENPSRQHAPVSSAAAALRGARRASASAFLRW